MINAVLYQLILSNDRLLSDSGEMIEFSGMSTDQRANEYLIVLITRPLTSMAVLLLHPLTGFTAKRRNPYTVPIEKICIKYRTIIIWASFVRLPGTGDITLETTRRAYQIYGRLAAAAAAAAYIGIRCIAYI